MRSPNINIGAVICTIIINLKSGASRTSRGNYNVVTRRLYKFPLLGAGVITIPKLDIGAISSVSVVKVKRFVRIWVDYTIISST